MLSTKNYFGLYTAGLIFSICLVCGCARSNTEWTSEQLSLIKSLSLRSLSELPVSPSNKYVDDTGIASLGMQLFFDKRLSGNREVACASCHQPSLSFTDGLDKAKGMGIASRNTPSLLGVAWQEWLYWDGRKDSLWSQALAPLEATNEMGSTRMEVLRVIGHDANYRRMYTKTFGEFPFGLLSKKLPARASPMGDTGAQSAWYGLSTTQQQQINRVFSNIGKAIAAYERTLQYQPTAFDRFASALDERNYREAQKWLDDDAIAGLKLFLNENKTECLRCHNGPFFSNGHFHNVGSGRFSGKELDMGRFIGVQTVLLDEFNCLGPYSDAAPEQCIALRFLNKDIDESMRGAYKTPSLRNLADTAPYFHDGRHATLEDVISFYSDALPADAEIESLALTTLEQQHLLAFLKTLSTSELHHQ